MRILHLSDIHLSKENINEIRFYIENIGELFKNRGIDLIIISGDLVDKSGASLIGVDQKNPFEIFDQHFLIPIINKLSLTKDNVIFCIGNHDINLSTSIGNEFEEKLIYKGLKSIIDSSDKANETLENIKNSNLVKEILMRKQSDYNSYLKKHIINFNCNEEKFINDLNQKSLFIHSEFESLFLYRHSNKILGFLLTNDVYLISNESKKVEFIGINQIDLLNNYKKVNIDYKFIVSHYPVSELNHDEILEIKNKISDNKINFHFSGDKHALSLDAASNPLINNHLYYLINSGTSFNKLEEEQSRYKPRIGLLDFNFDNNWFDYYEYIYYKNIGFKEGNKAERQIISVTNDKLNLDLLVSIKDDSVFK